MSNKENSGNAGKKIILLIFLFVIFSACAAVQKADKPELPREKEQLTAEEKLGIDVIGIRPTAAGFMLIFRYRILDADKASAIAGPKVKPYIIEQKTGRKYSVPDMPKVGALRQRSQKPNPGRIFFILFSNPLKSIKSGDMVTLVIGDYKIENLTVE